MVLFQISSFAEMTTPVKAAFAVEDNQPRPIVATAPSTLDSVSSDDPRSPDTAPTAPEENTVRSEDSVPRICCICQDDCEPVAYKCSGSEPHYICRICGQAYVEAALDPGGAFDVLQYMRGDEESGVRCEASRIPCPRFVDPQNPCDCGALAYSEFFRLLSDNDGLPEKFEKAVRRFIAHTDRMERIQANKNNAATDDDQEAASTIRTTVETVHR